MPAPNIVNGVAKLFLEPEHIDTTILLVEELYRNEVDAKHYDTALHASQLLAAVQKLRDKQQKAVAK